MSAAPTQAGTAASVRPSVLGRALSSLGALEGAARHGQAFDRRRLAPKGFQALLDLEEPKQATRRPRIDKDIRKLIIEMASTNVGWGAPRIHGELLKLGIMVSQSTVQRYMPKRKAPPGSRQRWRTFLHNHMHESLAINFAG